MDDEKGAFYVVRKGDIIGVYNSLSDCQSQAGSSVWDPAPTVYKGHSLPNEAQKYLASHGLKNAMYCIKSDDVKEDLFGQLVPCPFPKPFNSVGKLSDKDFPQKRSSLPFGSEQAKFSGSCSENSSMQGALKKSRIEAQSVSSGYFNSADSEVQGSCILNFDGASKGNPGLAGAGAVLYTEDGNQICRLREGVGISTNNVAEYRGLILGLKYALRFGFRSIQVFGDSKLVVNQVQGLWKTRNQNMADLCKVAQELKHKFLSFHISHVERALNSEADAEANQGAILKGGQVVEEFGKPQQPKIRSIF